MFGPARVMGTKSGGRAREGTGLGVPGVGSTPEATLQAREECVQAWLTTVVQLFRHVRLFATLWTAARQASLSFTISQILLKLMSIESMTPSNHLVFCYPLPLPSIFPSIRVFSNESALSIRWPEYWSFSFSSFSISPSNEHSGLIYL